jgi:hypothetical protein
MTERKTNVRKMLTPNDLAVKALGLESIKSIVEKGEFAEIEYEKLYAIYYNEMDYGTMKARTGDPYEFIYKKLCEIVNKK